MGSNRFGRYFFKALPTVVYSAFSDKEQNVTLCYWAMCFKVSSAEFDGMLRLGMLNREFDV